MSTFKEGLWQWLDEDISKLVFGLNKLDLKKLLCITFPHKVIINFDVFHSGVKYQI
jgi:hypothetical protein